MMTRNFVILYGKRTRLIDKPKMEKMGLDVSYNYYDGEGSENAGFDRENFQVYSGKICSHIFNRVLLAACALEELYTDSATFIEENEVVEGSACVGWINYLFNEKFGKKNFDLWNSFEAIRYCEPDGCEFYP